ncbi:SdiA-regulated domain-containing protein [Chitinophagaceae bacterium LWZ2-11]
MSATKIIKSIFPGLLLISISSCNQLPYASPKGYDLHLPQKIVLKSKLHEISGIAFVGNDYNKFYSINDEDGILFEFNRSNKKYAEYNFGKKGDYEDLTVWKNKYMFILRSDGAIYKFPVSQIGKTNIDSVKTYKHILPPGEYEGLYADKDGRIMALCKHCDDDVKKSKISMYILLLNENDELIKDSHVEIDLSSLPDLTKKKKERFKPSALAQHPISGDWYIVSSVNKMLVVMDQQWKIKEAYNFVPHLFSQPEGLAFDSTGNMYISNEGKEGTDGNILVLKYTK